MIQIDLKDLHSDQQNKTLLDKMEIPIDYKLASGNKQMVKQNEKESFF